MTSDSDSDVNSNQNITYYEISERDFVQRLIDLYRENPILWDTTHEDYTNKYRRAPVMKKICEELQAFKPDYTVENLKKKLNILRTNYNKERKKIEIQKAASPDEEARPRTCLWYYPELKFLSGEEVPPRKTSPNDGSFVRTISTTTPRKMFQKLKRKKISIISESNAASPMIKQSENEEELLLAKCWAMKLRKLSRDQRLFAEKIVNDTLFEAELGALTRHGVTFNTETTVWTQYENEEHSGPETEYKSGSP